MASLALGVKGVGMMGLSGVAQEEEGHTSG